MGVQNIYPKMSASIPRSIIKHQEAKIRAMEILMEFLHAYGPVTIPQLQQEGADQVTGLSAYNINCVITDLLNSKDVELYDVTSDGVAAFWLTDTVFLL